MPTFSIMNIINRHLSLFRQQEKKNLFISLALGAYAAFALLQPFIRHERLTGVSLPVAVAFFGGASLSKFVFRKLTPVANDNPIYYKNLFNRTENTFFVSFFIAFISSILNPNSPLSFLEKCADRMRILGNFAFAFRTIGLLLDYFIPENSAQNQNNNGQVTTSRRR